MSRKKTKTQKPPLSQEQQEHALSLLHVKGWTQERVRDLFGLTRGELVRRLPRKPRGPWTMAGDIMRGVRKRCRESDWLYCADDFDQEYVYRSITDNPYCADTGLPFVGIIRHPHVPSPDRKDPEIGYTRANVKFVRSWSNLARNNQPQADHTENIKEYLVFNKTGVAAEEAEDTPLLTDINDYPA